MSEHTKGKLHRHALAIDIRKANGDHTLLANMSESSTAYLPVYEVQAANAEHLVKCWNSHDNLLATCKMGILFLNSLPSTNIKCISQNRLAYRNVLEQAIAEAEND